MNDPLALLVARSYMAERLAQAESDRIGRHFATPVPSSRPPARRARRRSRLRLRVLSALRS